MNPSFGPDEKVWIVKSSTYITGPYSQNEVFEQIKQRQVVAIDEIAAAFGNWAFVRDIELFRNELLKANAASAGEITKTMSSNTQDATDQLTSTNLMDDTEELSALNAIDKTNPNPDIAPLNFKTPPARRPVHPNARANSFNFPKFVMSMLAFISLAVGSYYAYMMIMERRSPEINVAESLAKGHAGFLKGDLSEAYIHFQNVVKSGTASEQAPGFFIQMAALVLNQERQTVYARDLLSQAPTDIQSSPEWLTVQGLSFLIDQNYQMAESFFVQSIRKNPNFLAAWVNLGHLYLAQKKFQEAWDYFFGAYVRGYYEGHIPLFMALSLIEQWQINSDSLLLLRAQQLLENYMLTNSDRKDQLSIISIWLALKIPDLKKTVPARIEAFIERDPYGYSQIRRSAYEYVYDSKNLEAYCAQVFRELPKDKMNTLLYSSLCYQRIGFMGDIVEAPIKKAAEKFSTEPLVYGAQAVVLSQMGEQYQKSLLIGRALSSDAKSLHNLPLILQAHFCEEKGDLNCSLKYWRQVNERDPFEVGAYSGIAKSLLSQRKTTEAQQWVQSGLLIAPSYKPLIELQLKIM